MKLSRTDLLPVLTIVAGGLIGASLSFGFLGQSAADDVPGVALGLLYEPSAPLESEARVGARVGTVTGQVTDASSGSPVAAVQVYISSLELGGLSQRNGRYLLRNVPAGTYTLAVTRIGYRTLEAQITIDGRQTVQTVEHNFSIADEALQLDPLVVPGTPGPVNIRGFSSIEIGNQPLIYVDGIRVDNSFGLGPGGSALDDINPNDIESIEIIKGPAAATLYGTEASAGVIQIITKKERRR